MDLNSDGIRDIITGGSHGDIYIFPGQQDGSFGARETILDTNGGNINVISTSAPYAVDWDRDGDLDLLAGNRTGEVYFIPNLSNGVDLELGEKEKLQADNRVIRAASPGEAGPYVTDWDGDGNHDLLLGCGNGSVQFYRNSAGSGMPVLAAPVELVPKSGAYSRDQTHYDPKEDRGAGAKVFVTDWNGDGRNDLLVGIIKSESEDEPELTPGQEAEKEKVEEEYFEVFQKYSNLREDASKRVFEAMGISDSRNLPRERQGEFSEKLKVELEKVEGYSEIRAQLLEVTEKRRAYYPQYHVYGWVWVYLRK